MSQDYPCRLFYRVFRLNTLLDEGDIGESLGGGSSHGVMIPFHYIILVPCLLPRTILKVLGSMITLFNISVPSHLRERQVPPRSTDDSQIVTSRSLSDISK